MSPGNFAVHVCGWLIGLPLEGMLITALLRGSYKRFPILFIYAAAALITTLVEIPPYTQAFRDRVWMLTGFAARVYWTKVWILQGLAFALVISLIDQASANVRRRRLARAGVIAGAGVFAVTVFFIHYGGPAMVLTYWITPWMRDLNFGAAILDLTLWAVLIAAPQADRRLLLITSALGMQFTGEMIGEALRKLSAARLNQPVFLTGLAVAMLAELACLYLWWRAFRPAKHP